MIAFWHLGTSFKLESAGAHGKHLAHQQSRGLHAYFPVFLYLLTCMSGYSGEVGPSNPSTVRPGYFGVQGKRMNNVDFTPQHSQHRAAPDCPHYLGTQQQEPWCAARDPRVHYAYEIVNEPHKLTLGDALILHSLGVTWSERAVKQ